MNSDFRIDCRWHEHQKTCRLRNAAGSEGVDALLGLWTFAALHRPEGDLSGLSDAQLAAKAGWRRAAHKLFAVLEQCGWVEGPEGERHLHDWAEHQGWASHAEHRRKAARQANKIRWDRIRSDVRSDDPPSPSPSPSPSPDPTTKKEPAALHRRAASPKKRDAFADHCFEAWRSRHGQAPPWGQREYVNLAAARKRFAEPGGEELARAAWGRYLEAEDDFHAGHGPGKFLSDLSRWAVEREPAKTASQAHNEQMLAYFETKAKRLAERNP